MKHSIETQIDWKNDLKVKREVKVTLFQPYFSIHINTAEFCKQLDKAQKAMDDFVKSVSEINPKDVVIDWSNTVIKN